MIGYSVGNGTAQIFKDSLGRIYVNAYVDGTLTDASGSVTVTVTDEAGNVVINEQTATNESTGVYYYDLGISNTTNVNKLYAVWTGTWETVSQKLRTNHEIMGFPIFTEKQAREFDIQQLSSASDYPDATIFEEISILVTSLCLDLIKTLPFSELLKLLIYIIFELSLL